MSEISKNSREGVKTFSYLLVGLMAFVMAAAAQAADWTDANSVTYTALKSINGNGSGVIVTDFTPAGTEIVKFKYKPSTVSNNEFVFCSRFGTTTNVITTDNHWFQMRKPITVESGAVLRLPNGGPWYTCFTNQANATIIIPASQVCLGTGSVLKNDGTVINTGTGDFILGHRDNTTGACRVENNGLIRTSGTRFWFKTQSSMTGTGTLELQYGDRLISWTEAPSGVRFKLQGEYKGILRNDDTGLVYAK